MDPHLNQLILLFGLLLVSGMFSLAETAMFSLPKSSLAEFKTSLSIFHKYVVELLDKPRQLIITFVMCNELVNAAFSVVVASLVYQWCGELGTGKQLLISTTISTTLIILFGDLIPKAIGMLHSKNLVIVVAPPIKLFFKLMAPFRIVFLSFVDRLIKILGGDRVEAEDMIKQDEFRRLVDESYRSGELEEVEAKLIHKVFDFTDKVVGPLAKDIKETYSLDIAMPIADLVKTLQESPYSRVPVYKKNQHNIIGVIHKKVLLKLKKQFAEGGKVKLEPFIRQAVYIFPKWSLDKVLRIMRRNHTHIAFTVSEYGEVTGIVTLDDLLQQIFGELGT